MKTAFIKFSVISFVLLYGAAAALIYSFNQHQKTDRLNTDLKRAESFLNLMIDTRQWNAEHGKLYVQSNRGLEPNKYLPDNTLTTDKGTLVRINPAWMTKQISEISEENQHTSFNITALEPINPDNKANPFETEALHYFETHPGQTYYYRYNQVNGLRTLEFMGALKMQQSCLQCHQGKVGDLRGGIRVTMPMTESPEVATSQKIFISTIILGVTVIYILLLYLFRKLAVPETRPY